MSRDRLIHRLPSHRFADFDDFLWPVNAALVVFGLCVAGVVIAESDFHTPVLVYNGWVRLGSLMTRTSPFWLAVTAPAPLPACPPEPIDPCDDPFCSAWR